MTADCTNLCSGGMAEAVPTGVVDGDAGRRSFHAVNLNWTQRQHAHCLGRVVVFDPQMKLLLYQTGQRFFLRDAMLKRDICHDVSCYLDVFQIYVLNGNN